jgi:ribonuclease R
MEVSQELVARIRALVGQPGYRPMKPYALAAAIGLEETEYPSFRRAVKSMVKLGELEFGANHYLRPPSAPGSSERAARVESPDTGRRALSPPSPEGKAASGPRDELTGIYRRARDGFGFFRPQAADAGRFPDDLFIPEGEGLGALDGDRVIVRLVGRVEGPSSERSTDRESIRGVEARASRERRGPTARVIRVLDRARRQFTATFALVDGRPLGYLDGWPFEHPVELGDVRGLPLEDDDKIVVEVVKFPGEDGRHAEGVILEVLGSSRNPAIDTVVIMRQYGLPESFPEPVIDDARGQVDQFEEGVPGDRRDLTELLSITIDPHDARDFDDAISLQPAERGHWRLFVHIADVAHFVTDGSLLDMEARKRATSVYLPDRVVPMLPEQISNHLASLQPDRVRLTKTVELEYSAEGTVVHTEVYRSAIRSGRRLNYDEVDEFLAAPESFRDPWGEPVCTLLSRMHSLAMLLRGRRRKQGGLELDLPEVKIQLDKGGKVRGAHLVQHTESHQIIEEFMLAANQAVALWLDDQRIEFLHRIHPPPDRRKLRQLTRFVQDLGLPCDDLTSRFAIQDLLEQVRGTRLRDAVHYAVLKSLQKAIYAPDREGHYALDFQHYCHFTSPIRRYPDLTIHRLVDRLLVDRRRPPENVGELRELGEHCSEREQNAESAERELIRLKLLHHLAKQVGLEFAATVNRVRADGLAVWGLEWPIEAKVPLEHLPRDRYRFERHGHTLEGFREGNQFRLGDRVRIRVARVDLRKRELIATLVAREGDDFPTFGGGQTGGDRPRGRAAHGSTGAGRGGAGRSRKAKKSAKPPGRSKPRGPHRRGG